MSEVRHAPLHKCIATVAQSRTLQDKLETAATVGFDGVEIMESDLLAFDGSASDVRRMAEDLGLAIDLYQPFRDFEAIPEPQRGRNLDRAERKFHLMQELGAELVLVCSNTQPAVLDDDARAAANLAAMAERADRRGLRIGYEALSWAWHMRLWSHAWRIVQQAGHPALALIVDSLHTLALRDDLASGYQGPLSLEMFNDHFRAAPARMIARDGPRSLILAEAQAIGPEALPAIPEVRGIEFLKFAVDEAATEALAEFLIRLGFRHWGRHRSKAIDLYCQGCINLVLNCEQDTAASEHFQHHGPTVCAMALRVDDPAAVLARAGQHPTPAVHGPDGTLISLMGPDENFWQDDFHRETAAADGAGLDALGPLAPARPAGRMDTAVLFWRSLFKLEPQPMWDLPDPYGLIQSRAVVSPAGTLRLTFNISEARETATNRFVSTFSGAGVHHVAFSTADAPRTVERLAETGGLS